MGFSASTSRPGAPPVIDRGGRFAAAVRDIGEPPSGSDQPAWAAFHERLRSAVDDEREAVAREDFRFWKGLDEAPPLEVVADRNAWEVYGEHVQKIAPPRLEDEDEAGAEAITYAIHDQEGSFTDMPLARIAVTQEKIAAHALALLPAAVRRVIARAVMQDAQKTMARVAWLGERRRPFGYAPDDADGRRELVTKLTIESREAVERGGKAVDFEKLIPILARYAPDAKWADRLQMVLEMEARAAVECDPRKRDALYARLASLPFSKRSVYRRCCNRLFWTPILRKRDYVDWEQAHRCFALLGIGLSPLARQPRDAYMPHRLTREINRRRQALHDLDKCIVMRSSSGDEVTRADLLKGRDANQLSELWVRACGAMAYWSEKNFKGHGITISLPSRFHSVATVGDFDKKTNIENERFDFHLTPQDGHEWAAEQWVKLRARLADLKITIWFLDCWEVHKDCTPHHHDLLFCLDEHWATVRRLLRDYFVYEMTDRKKLAREELEPGALKYRIKVDNFNKSRDESGQPITREQHAARYLLKTLGYIKKTGEDGAKSEGEDGKLKPASAQALAYSAQNIRRFNMSQDRVGLWRFLRGVPVPDVLPEHIRPAWAAAHGLDELPAPLPVRRCRDYWATDWTADSGGRVKKKVAGFSFGDPDLAAFYAAEAARRKAGEPSPYQSETSGEHYKRFLTECEALPKLTPCWFESDGYKEGFEAAREARARADSAAPCDPELEVLEYAACAPELEALERAACAAEVKMVARTNKHGDPVRKRGKPACLVDEETGTVYLAVGRKVWEAGEPDRKKLQAIREDREKKARAAEEVEPKNPPVRPALAERTGQFQVFKKADLQLRIIDLEPAAQAKPRAFARAARPAHPPGAPPPH